MGKKTRKKFEKKKLDDQLRIFFSVMIAGLMGIMLAKVSVEEDNIAYSIALHMGFNLNVLPIWVVNHIPAWKQLFFSSHGMIALYGGGACFLAVWLLKSYRKETTLW